MSQDEIAVMNGSKCILQLRGVLPFFSDKFDITKHPNYRLLSDFDKKNEFDIEKYLKKQRKQNCPASRRSATVAPTGAIACIDYCIRKIKDSKSRGPER